MLSSADFIPFATVAFYPVIGIVLTHYSGSKTWLAIIISGIVTALAAVTFLHLKMMVNGYHNLQQIFRRVYGPFMSFISTFFLLLFITLSISIFGQSVVYHIYYYRDLSIKSHSYAPRMLLSTYDTVPAMVIIPLVIISKAGSKLNRTTISLINAILLMVFSINLLKLAKHDIPFFHQRADPFTYDNVVKGSLFLMFAYASYPLFMVLLNRNQTSQIEVNYGVTWMFSTLTYIFPVLMILAYTQIKHCVWYALIPSALYRPLTFFPYFWFFVPIFFNIIIILVCLHFSNLLGQLLVVEGLLPWSLLQLNHNEFVPSVPAMLVGIGAAALATFISIITLIEAASGLILVVYILISFTTILYPSLSHNPTYQCPCTFGGNGKFDMTNKKIYELYLVLKNIAEDPNFRKDGKKFKKQNKKASKKSGRSNNNKFSQQISRTNETNMQLFESGFNNTSSEENLSMNNNSCELNMNENQSTYDYKIYRLQCRCKDHDEEIPSVVCWKCTNNLHSFIQHYNYNHSRNKSNNARPFNNNHGDISDEDSKIDVGDYSLQAVICCFGPKQLMLAIFLLLYSITVFFFVRYRYVVISPISWYGILTVIVILAMISISLTIPYLINQCPSERMTYTSPFLTIIIPMFGLTLQVILLSFLIWQMFIILTSFFVVTLIVYLLFTAPNIRYTHPNQLWSHADYCGDHSNHLLKEVKCLISDLLKTLNFGQEDSEDYITMPSKSKSTKKKKKKKEKAKDVKEKPPKTVIHPSTSNYSMGGENSENQYEIEVESYMKTSRSVSMTKFNKLHNDNHGLVLKYSTPNELVGNYDNFYSLSTEQFDEVRATPITSQILASATRFDFNEQFNDEKGEKSKQSSLDEDLLEKKLQEHDKYVIESLVSETKEQQSEMLNKLQLKKEYEFKEEKQLNEISDNLRELELMRKKERKKIQDLETLLMNQEKEKRLMINRMKNDMRMKEKELLSEVVEKKKELKLMKKLEMKKKQIVEYTMKDSGKEENDTNTKNWDKRKENKIIKEKLEHVENELAKQRSLYEEALVYKRNELKEQQEKLLGYLNGPGSNSDYTYTTYYPGELKNYEAAKYLDSEEVDVVSERSYRQVETEGNYTKEISVKQISKRNSRGLIEPDVPQLVNRIKDFDGNGYLNYEKFYQNYDQSDIADSDNRKESRQNRKRIRKNNDGYKQKYNRFVRSASRSRMSKIPEGENTLDNASSYHFSSVGYNFLDDQSSSKSFSHTDFANPTSNKSRTYYKSQEPIRSSDRWKLSNTLPRSPNEEQYVVLEDQYSGSENFSRSLNKKKNETKRKDFTHKNEKEEILKNLTLNNSVSFSNSLHDERPFTNNKSTKGIESLYHYGTGTYLAISSSGSLTEISGSRGTSTRSIGLKETSSFPSSFQNVKNILPFPNRENGQQNTNANNQNNSFVLESSNLSSGGRTYRNILGHVKRKNRARENHNKIITIEPISTDSTTNKNH
ncbi:hypothetical protein SNEBB_010252 [Seison nebaliae]|nr:hypothetical protein SNEBB_010252 [Seison nebaliae]